MKKDENELPSRITRRQLTGSIIITVLCVPLFYLSLLISKNVTSEIRIVEGTIGVMHAIAPPWFWTILLSSLFLYEIIRLSVKFVRQKKEEKGGVEEE